jgi:DNA-binding NtrC family response regulator
MGYIKLERSRWFTMVRTQVNIPLGMGMTLPEIERIVIEATLLRNGGNKAATARALDLSLSTLQRRLREYRKTKRK